MISELAIGGDRVAAFVAEQVVALEAPGGRRALLAAEAGDRYAGGGPGGAAGVVPVVVVVVRAVILTGDRSDGVLRGRGGRREGGPGPVADRGDGRGSEAGGRGHGVHDVGDEARHSERLVAQGRAARGRRHAARGRDGWRRGHAALQK